MQRIDSIDVSASAQNFASLGYEISINGEAIGETEILQEMQYHKADQAAQAQHAAAKALVIKALLLQQAKLHNVKTQPQAKETSEEAIIRQLLEQQIKTLPVSEKDCRHYYTANKDKFKSPTLMAVSHILLAADPRDDQERTKAKLKAEALIKKLTTHPKQFPDLAKHHSDCPSKDTQGNMGQISKGSTVPEFEHRLTHLPVGLANTPIESRYGFHVVRMDQRVEGQPLPYEHVASKILNYLEDRVYHQAISDYLAQIIDNADILGIDMHTDTANKSW